MAPKKKDETKWTSFPDERGIQYRKLKVRGKVRMQYRARVIANVDGKRVELTRIAWTRSDARNARADLLHEAKNPSQPELPPPPPPKGETLTFAELADEYQADHIVPPVYDNEQSDDRNKVAGIAAKSVQDGERTLKLFKASKLGAMLVRDITSHDIKKWKIERLQTPKERGDGQRSLANVHRELAVLRGAFTYAIRAGYITKNPFTGAKLINLKHEKPRERPLEFWEITALLNVADESLKQILIFQLQTAARIGESLQVERRDIDLDAGTVTLRKRVTKEKKERELPMTRDVREVVESRLAEMSDDPNAKLFDKTYYSYEYALQKAAAQSGLTDIQFHDCRHTWITRAVPSGIPLAEAMKISGHTNVDTFLRYLNPTKESHRVNAERFQTYWRTNMEGATTATELVN